MIPAPVGTRIEGEWTVAPRCADATGRFALCLTHGTSAVNRAALEAHLRQYAKQLYPGCLVASLCWQHGVENAESP